MRQLTFLGPGRLEWQEAPTPALEGPGQALVRPVVATTCDLDRWLISGGAPSPPPFPLGHEFVADVVEVGDEVRGVAPGARVTVPYSISCGACDRCRRGITASCTTVPVGAMYGVPVRGQWGGAMSDLVRVPFADAMLVPLPDGVAPTTVASLSDNLPDGWRTVAPHLAARPGAEVLVAGGGAVSIYFEATTPLPLLEMFTDGVTFITARASSRPIIPDILEAVAGGRIHPERITSAIVPCDDAIDALLEVPTKLVMERV